jgi:FkbH-like protein
MKDDLLPAGLIVHEWIAVSPTFLKTSGLPADELSAAQKLAVQPGSRLVAVVALEALGHVWLRDPVLDGAHVPSDFSVILSEDWKPVKPHDATAAAGEAELTVAHLTGARWSFGDVGRLPWSMAFHFAPDGAVTGEAGINHKFWRLEDGVLRIFKKNGDLSFQSDRIRLQDGALRVGGVGCVDPLRPKRVVLTELPDPAVARQAVPVAAGEQVKLIIWDLDDTFWQGTLAEGGMTPIPAHIDLVRQMSARGIVNSICSKNEFVRTRTALEALGIWDHFIFPRIDFVPKGAMIKEIIEAAQLRAPSVLFIDDNEININEALHYNPGLQVCMPDAIAGLLADPRCKGKPDPELKRLANYKVLEKKSSDKSAAGSDNIEFLRQSEIRVSFHYDIMAEFPRIHDLVNRSNQLNFTKRRWPEDIEAARKAFQAEMDEEFNSHCGYVKVSDRYGNYGIVGFYQTRLENCPHFLFSCRTLNMGIEQFVWQRLGRPQIKIVGEVVSQLGDKPDWISVVEDADLGGPSQADLSSRPSICLRGACDLSMMTHYLRANFDTVEEFTYPYNRWSIFPAARAVALHDEIKAAAGGQALIDKLPGMPEHRFTSGINTGNADIYILSFSPEVFPGLYKSKSTGLILPLGNDFMRNVEFSSVKYDDIADMAAPAGTTREHWDFLSEEFSLYGYLDLDLLARDVEWIFRKLSGKRVIAFALNTEVGNNQWLLQTWGKINDVVLPLAAKYGCQILRVNEFVKTEADLIEPHGNGAHFRRDIYRQFAERVKELIGSTVAAKELLPA